MGKAALILGLIGVFFGGCVFFISLMLPILTEGRTSWEEAILGIIPGALILTLSFIVAVVGLIVILMRRKRARDGTT